MTVTKAPLAPIVKWVGGKRQLLPEILPLVPQDLGVYCEPFLGGGAVLWALQPNVAIVNDLNAELINLYEVVRKDVKALIKELKRHKNDKDYFYQVRDLDRDEASYRKMSRVARAGRLLFLNKTCFNGLFRVNSQGFFNTPFGDYKNPNIVNEEGLMALYQYLTTNDVTFLNEDFASVMNKVPEGGFVYLDPPYDPVSETSSFTGYNKGGFDRQEQVRLKECCDELHRRGIRFMLSNSATDFIKDLYKDYDVRIVKAKRNINSVGSKRSAIDEVLVINY